mmetsp:Transcript_71770/g.202715  ORF Transcript_71770/g.202715 Transcript_71770/m.202715 type:complete len:298 (+) Transcript_71770:488-1381(+)
MPSSDSSSDSEAEAKRRRKTKWDPDADPGGLAMGPQNATSQFSASATLARLASQAAARHSDTSRPRVYVGNLDTMVTEQEIMQIFSPFGMVTGIDMPKEGTPPVTKGFAFVEYAQQGSADKAIQVLQDFFLNGRRMRVGQPTAQKRQTASPGVIPQMAQTMPSGGGVSSDPAAVMSAAERRRIAVSNIPQDTQQASIQTIFQTFGMITRVDVIPDASATLVHSGTFVVEFASEASAAQAFQAMQGFKLGGISLSLYRGTPPPRSAPPAAAAAAAAAARAGGARGDRHEAGVEQDARG